MCLSENTPHFKWFWKLGFYYACHTHFVFMVGSCENCDKPINIMSESYEIQYCNYCKFDFRTSKLISIDEFDFDYHFIVEISSNFINGKPISNIKLVAKITEGSLRL